MKKLIKKIIKLFLNLISAIRSDAILKYVSYFLVLKGTKNRYKNNEAYQVNALVIDKSGFDTDLLPLQKSQKINLYLFPANLLMTIVKSFLDEKLHCQM